MLLVLAKHISNSCFQSETDVLPSQRRNSFVNDGKTVSGGRGNARKPTLTSLDEI